MQLSTTQFDSRNSGKFDSPRRRDPYKEVYDTRADLFSAGKTVYFIARGAMYDESKSEDEKWDGMDFWLKHFLRNLMQVTPSLRMSADEAMQHPFYLPCVLAGSTILPAAIGSNNCWINFEL